MASPIFRCPRSQHPFLFVEPRTVAQSATRGAEDDHRAVGTFDDTGGGAFRVRMEIRNAVRRGALHIWGRHHQCNVVGFPVGAVIHWSRQPSFKGHLLSHWFLFAWRPRYFFTTAFRRRSPHSCIDDEKHEAVRFGCSDRRDLAQCLCAFQRAKENRGATGDPFRPGTDYEICRALAVFAVEEVAHHSSASFVRFFLRLAFFGIHGPLRCGIGLFGNAAGGTVVGKARFVGPQFEFF